MSALLGVTIQVKDPDRLKDDIAQVPATMAPSDAKMLSRGELGKTLNGELNHQIEAVFELPSEDALHGCYHSDAYQALIPLRHEVCNMTLAVLAPL